MTITSYNGLLLLLGHKISIANYNDKSLCIECEDCHEVLYEEFNTQSFNWDNLNAFWSKTHILCDKLIKEYQKLDDNEAIDLLKWIKNSDLEYNREIRRFNELFGITEALDTSKRHLKKIKRLAKKLYKHVFSVFQND